MATIVGIVVLTVLAVGILLRAHYAAHDRSVW